MILGTMSLPESLVDHGFKWFKKYYDLAIVGTVQETAEEVFVLLGGKLPEKDKKK